MYDAKSENVFCAYSEAKLYATACLYPFPGSPDIGFPFNIYFGIYPKNGSPSDEIKSILLENIKEWAKEIKLQYAQQIPKLYLIFIGR